MHSQTLARGIAAGAVLVAAALVVVSRAPNDAPPAAPVDDSRPFPGVDTAADDGAEPTVAESDNPAADTIRELEAMSETFRNTTFLIAIRDAGHVCNELLRVSGGLDGASKWMVTCSETLAYTVGVASNGALHVEPFLQYFDGVGVRPIERLQPLEPGGERVLPPEPLPQR